VGAWPSATGSDAALRFAVGHRCRRIVAQARELDRFEQERADFHERVRLAYLERAALAPQRIQVIDADQAPEVIRKLIQEARLQDTVYEHIELHSRTVWQQLVCDGARNCRTRC
jgi:hypothetical protein